MEVSNQLDERAWLQQAMAGNRGAFGRLVEAYQKPVYNLTYRMLGNHAEAEEAAQETFLKAYTRLGTYDAGRKFSTWLLSIASHHCIDRLRRRRFTWLSIEDNPSVAWLASDRERPDETVLRMETGEEVRLLLLRLDPNYRLPLVLRYWHDLSYQEIAGVMGITEAAVKSRLHRARHQIADLMANQPEIPVSRTPSMPGIIQAL